MLIIRSKRLLDEWYDDGYNEDKPLLTLSAFEQDLLEEPYLTWYGDGLTLSISSTDIGEEIYRANLEGLKIIMVWVADTILSINSFEPDEDFMDFWSVVGQSAEMGRYRPDQLYIDNLVAKFPPLLCSEEERYVDHNGAPAYVLEKLDNSLVCCEDASK